MNPEILRIPLEKPVHSLCWRGDELVDWVDGGRVISLDGSVTEAHQNWAYRFDLAVQSECGRYAIIYERLGTKAVVLDQGKFVRELNRSYYCAHVYEYPVTLLEQGGRVLIAHCPEEYNRIEIDDVATGERLTAAADREPGDMFHSRLLVSPGMTRLLSAGWIWHPLDAVSTWSIAEALADGRALDAVNHPGGDMLYMSSAVFVDEDRVLVSSNLDDDELGGESEFVPGSLGLFNLVSNAWESVAPAEEMVGTMMWLGDGLVVGLYDSPRVFEVATGRIVCRLPEIATGKQTGSLLMSLELPALARDPARRRFAVASEDGIAVVAF